jgi:hypothetical protein
MSVFRPLLAMALVALCLCPGWARELAVNGGFEDGLSGLTAQVNASLDASGPHGGRWGVRIDGKAGQNNFVQQNVAVEAGRRYRFSVWVRCRDVPEGADAKAYYNVFAGSRHLGTFVPFPRLSGTAPWRELTAEVTMPAEADTCGVILQVYSSPGTVWYDDLSFCLVPTAAEVAAEQARQEGQRATLQRALARFEQAPQVAPGVRFLEDVAAAELFLSCGRTALTFGAGAAGFPLRSLVDVPSQAEFIVPGGAGELFRLELRPAVSYAYAATVVVPGRGVHRLEQDGGTVRLVLDFEPKGGAKATVTIKAKEGDLPRWRIDASAAGGQALWLVDFPCIDRLGPTGEREREYLALPSGQGRLELEPRRQARYAEGWSDYPGGGKTMQFEAYCAPTQGCGLYIATEDSHMYRKSTGYVGAGDWVTQSVRHYPENMGTCSEYRQPYDVVLGTFAGDWYDACRRYRSWALQQPWSAAGPVATRAEVPDWLRHIGAWGQGDMPGSSRAEMEPQVQRVARFAAAIEAPVAFHAYIWQAVGEHDAGYPVLDPKPGFAAAVTDMQVAGVRVVPYINVYSADARGPAWTGLNLTRLKLRPVLGRAYADLTHLVPMCPATASWQEICGGECRKLMGLLPVDGLYLDQLTGAPFLCFDPDHGHPLGGGTHFADGMRQVASLALAAVKEKRPDGMTFGENCCEIYNDRTAACLTWAEMEVAKRLPLYPAVYGDRVIRLGCFIGRPDTWGKAQGYYSKLALSFTWGEQLGWIMFGILNTFDDADLAPLRHYLRDLAKTRTAALDYLCYGQMLRPPVLDVPCLPVAWNDWAETRRGVLPTVLASAWRAENGRVAIALCNWTAEERTISVPMAPDWRPLAGVPARLCRAGEWSPLAAAPTAAIFTLTLPAHSAAVLEPGVSVDGER